MLHSLISVSLCLFFSVLSPWALGLVECYWLAVLEGSTKLPHESSTSSQYRCMSVEVLVAKESIVSNTAEIVEGSIYWKILLPD
jgi:hypothetical protein